MREYTSDQVTRMVQKCNSRRRNLADARKKQTELKRVVDAKSAKLKRLEQELLKLQQAGQKRHHFIKTEAPLVDAEVQRLKGLKNYTGGLG